MDTLSPRVAHRWQTSILVRSLAPLLAAACLLSTGTSFAASLETSITDKVGTPLEHAIVSLHTDQPLDAPTGTRATMDQRARQFDPTVIPIQAGTEVSFPNSDDVRHHVYSFSRPNAFELKLYHGEPSEPVLFDTPGIVVLGCNIHDGMIGYINVVATPLFSKSLPNGEAHVDAVPPGDYTLQVWHPDLGIQYLRRPIMIGEGVTRLTIKLDRAGIASNVPAIAAAGRDDGASKGVSPLQSLFRKN